MGLLFSFDWRMELIACLLFYLVTKMEVLRFSEKPYQTWQTAVKTFKKNQNAPKRTHKKSRIDKYT